MGEAVICINKLKYSCVIYYFKLNQKKMPKIVKSEKKIKKEKYWSRLQHIVANHKNCCFVDANNVSSKQICLIRAKLRAVNAVMIMGKNVSIIRVLFNHWCV